MIDSKKSVVIHEYLGSFTGFETRIMGMNACSLLFNAHVSYGD